MDVFVVGVGGLLGSNVVVEALERDLTVAGSYHSDTPAFDVPLRKLDIRDTDAFVDSLEEFDPSLVVNCAAMTDVDDCERRPERAHEINGLAPVELARVCSDRGTEFVHVSTDYVFDGKSADRYREDDDPNPIQEYGRSKLAGERGVRSSNDSVLVVRLSFVYGVNHSFVTPELEGFPAWVRSRLADGRDVPLFTDQHVTPSRARSTAESILSLADDGAFGTYHVAARSCITPYEFGGLLAVQIGADEERLVESSQAAVDQDAARPTNTCLSVSTVEERLGRPQPTIQEDVRALESFL
jgi:dTDP-4-dehydrorhamnose reductase